MNCSSTHFDVTYMFYQYAWYMNKLETFIFCVCFTMFSSTYTRCLWDTIKNQKPIVLWYFNNIIIIYYNFVFLQMIICSSQKFEGSKCSKMSQKYPFIWLINLCLLFEYFLIKLCHFQIFSNHFTCLVNNENIGYKFFNLTKNHSLNWLEIHSHFPIIYIYIKKFKLFKLSF